MPLRPLLPAAMTVAATPVAALAVLAGTGMARPLPALIAALVVAIASLALVRAWSRDHAAVLTALRGLLGGGGPAVPDTRVLPSTEMAQELIRLSRRLAETAAETGRLREADAAIVYSLPDPLIVLGADRSVRRTNPAARAAFGADLGSVLRHPALRAAIDRVLAQGVPQTAELVIPVPVARELQAVVIGLDTPQSPQLPAGDRVMAVLSDRTRERAVERMRADFIANASHELRTPLASLIGFIQTLRGPASDDAPAQQRFLGIMAEQAERMSRLIDDLLSLSRIELTEHQPPPDAVDLAALVPRIAAGHEPGLVARRQRLELAITPGLPLVAGDADQLAQVVQNLLDNAVKYGREGGMIRVAASAAAPGGGPVWPARRGVVLAVTDDGGGIPRADIPRLTERFYRVDKGRSRAVGGTGLGLAIVKHIVNRHRGQLAIESVEGQGSTFSIWLPTAD